MKIKTGVVKDGRVFDIELTDEDGLHQLGDAWNGTPLVGRYKLLAKLGDLMVLDYMKADGMISPEMASSRAAEIKAR